MSAYPLTRIADIKASERYSLAGGPFGSKLGRKDYRPHGVPVIRGANLPEDRKFLSREFVFVSEEKADELRANLARHGDVVVTQRGTLGQVGLIPQSSSHSRFVISQSQMKVTVDPAKASRDFVYYAISSPDVKSRIIGSALTAGVPHINLGIFEQLQIPLPGIEVQAKIASVLAAYDELIENNLRRIEILEEMARAIYREWFVDFRFPGHEMVPMVESELGPLPRGWETTTLGEAAEIVMGQSPKSEFYNETGEGLPFHQGVGTFGTRFPVTARHTTVTNRVAEKDDVLFSVRAPVGRINVAHERLVVGRGLAAIGSNRDNPWFLLQQMKEGFQQEDTMGGGTIFKAVTKADVHGIPYLLPPEAVEDAFDKTVDPISRLIENLVSQNRNLARSRDLLLPKLISGEIDVSDLDIDTSWLAA